MRGFVRRVAMPAVIAAVVLGGLVGTASSASAADGGRPGMPVPNCLDRTPVQDFYPLSPNGSYSNTCPFWFGAAQVGLAGAVKAQQWSPVSLSMVAFNAQTFGQTWEPKRDAPVGSKTANEWAYNASAFFISPKGSKQNYGLSAPIVVRTVAFGAIPAEVTLQVAQSTGADGLPEPLTTQLHDKRVTTGDRSIYNRTILDPAELSAKIDVRVLAVKVDGRDVGLNTTCGTGDKARLRLEAPGLTVDAPRSSPYRDTYLESVVFDPEKNFYGLAGGSLEGSLDIPGFSGCTTRLGDDLSPLLTSALSADANPISVRLGAIACAADEYDPDTFLQLPLQPGVNSPTDPEAGCQPASNNPPYEPNKRIKTVPKIFDLPNTPVRPVTDEE